MQQQASGSTAPSSGGGQQAAPLLAVQGGAGGRYPGGAGLPALLPRQPVEPLSLCAACAPQINVFLRVVRRREDGYHDLASLFHVRGAVFEVGSF